MPQPAAVIFLGLHLGQHFPELALYPFYLLEQAFSELFFPLFRHFLDCLGDVVL